MTEFVIIIPVMLLLLTGLYQFALLSIDKVKLAMVEREIMMFLTEEDNKDDKWERFGRETAEKLGLLPDKLKVSAGEEKENSAMSGSKDLGPLAAFKGVDIKVSYDHDLLPAFKAMTGKDFLRLETHLASAAGGSFKVQLKKGIDGAFEALFGSGGSQDKYEEDMLNREKEWKPKE